MRRPERRRSVLLFGRVGNHLQAARTRFSGARYRTVPYTTSGVVVCLRVDGVGFCLEQVERV